MRAPRSFVLVISCSVALALGAGCRNSKQSPSGAASAAPGASATAGAASGSRLVYLDIDAKKQSVKVEAAGAALARQLPDGTFMIYVYSADIDPKPTCDALRPAERNGAKGSQLGLVLPNYTPKLGKVKAGEVQIDFHKPSGEGASVINLHGPDVDVVAFDGKTLRANVVTPDPPDADVPRVDGTVLATLCEAQK